MGRARCHRKLRSWCAPLSTRPATAPAHHVEQRRHALPLRKVHICSWRGGPTGAMLQRRIAQLKATGRANWSMRRSVASKAAPDQVRLVLVVPINQQTPRPGPCEFQHMCCVSACARSVCANFHYGLPCRTARRARRSLQRTRCGAPCWPSPPRHPHADAAPAVPRGAGHPIWSAAGACGCRLVSL